MKATGIVRKIDDLGRIVIPKEIRKNLHIHEGDPLEIFVQTNGEIVLKKYAPMENILDISNVYVEVLNTVTGFVSCITDTETLISISGMPKNEYITKEISDEIINILKERKIYYTNNNSFIPILLNEKDNKYTSQLIIPIITDGDVLGSVILFSINDRKITELEKKIATSISLLLSKQLN